MHYLLALGCAIPCQVFSFREQLLPGSLTPIPLVSTELRLEDTKAKLSSLVCPGEHSQEGLSHAWDGILSPGEWEWCQCPPVPPQCHLSQQQAAPALPGQTGLEWLELLS